nr:MAG TPA: endosialidase chaperone [Caudoviricetes sp.]
MISGKNKELYYASSIDKQLNIEVIGTKHVIDNSTREQDTFTLTETLNDGTELKFGSCLPNQISFTGREVPIATKGMKLRVTETLEGNENDPFVYGTYTVQSDTPTADRTKRQIVAYDAMYDIINADVKSWYDGLSFPMTLKAFRDSFFAYLGIEQKETILVNDSMTVNKTLVTTQSDDSSVTAEATISGKTIIEAICELNGAFGNIGRGGRFEYVILKAITSALYPAEDLYPREDLFPSDANTESMTGHYITFDYEAFQSQAITQLEIRADDSTAGAIVGTSGNNYVISGNFLISDKTGAEMKQIANNLLPVIAQAEYTPIKSCTCVGNPCLELGDPIRFNTSREIVETYILQRTLTGVQSKRDSIVSAGTETHAMKNPTTRETVEALKRRTHILEENADHLQSTYEDLEQQTNTKFEQTTNSISAEVNRAQKAEGQLDASLELKLGRDENDQVISMINASADQIMLRGNRLIVESNNFRLDGAGRVTIIDSLNFNSTALGDDLTIIGLDGRGRPMLQNILIDLGTVTDSNEENLATESYVDNSLSDYATKSELPSGYFTDVDYTLNDSSTTKYSPRHFNKVADFGSRESTLDIEGLLISIPSSDKRLKNNIQSLRDIKSVYMAMRPVEYTWKSGYITQHTGLQFGLIAQDLEKILQDAGLSDSGLVLKEDAEEDEKAIHGDSKTWKIDKENLHAMHIQMIQMQQKEIELLQQKNEDLERRLSALERSVSHAENI